MLAGGEYYLLSHPSFLAGTGTPAAPNAGLGDSITTRLLLGTATFYQRYGLLIRAGILVAGGLLAVLLKAPPARPGQRRWQPTQLQLRRVQLGAAGVGLFTGALLGHAEVTPQRIAGIAVVAAGITAGLLAAQRPARPRRGESPASEVPVHV